jgi:hypothetical protein
MKDWHDSLDSVDSLPQRNNKNQARLRLAWTNPDLADEPRRYAQSTSGRMDSTGTSPPLSRSSAMAVDSAIRSFVESALRRYPTVVPQRAAYECWASRSRELRYLRSGEGDSIGRTLPYGKEIAIPFGHLPVAAYSYDESMSLSDTRRRRLRLLIGQAGSQKALSEMCGFQSDNYISQLLKPGKSFGEKAARRIEKGARKPEKWLDSDEETDSSPPPIWPFGFDRTLWDRLPPSRQRSLEDSFLTLVLGASVQEASSPPAKRSRTG